MALLNYALTYNEIRPYLSTSTPAPSNNDLLKIFISEDGHFITHGVDILKDFVNGQRGLVPSYTGNSDDISKSILLGNGSWSKITTDILPIDNTRTLNLIITQEGSNSKSFLPSVYLVNEFMNTMLATTDVMRFKGVISVVDGKIQSNSTDITKCELGDTYRYLSTSVFILAGEVVQNGDLIICIKDGEDTAENLNNSQYWRIIQTNIKGTVKHKINNIFYQVYTDQIGTSNDTFTIYAPSTGGTSGYILTSAGNTEPTWSNPTNIRVGQANSLFDSGNNSLYNVGNVTTPVYFENGIPKVCTSSVDQYSLLVTSTASNTSAANTQNPFINLIKTNASISTVGSSLQYIGTGHTKITNTGQQILIESTWRDILVPGINAVTNDVEWLSIGDKTIRFASSEDLYLKTATDTDDVTLSYGISWYNITTGKTETPTI